MRWQDVTLGVVGVGVPVFALVQAWPATLGTKARMKRDLEIAHLLPEDSPARAALVERIEAIVLRSLQPEDPERTPLMVFAARILGGALAALVAGLVGVGLTFSNLDSGDVTAGRVANVLSVVSAAMAAFILVAVNRRGDDDELLRGPEWRKPHVSNVRIVSGERKEPPAPGGHDGSTSAGA